MCMGCVCVCVSQLTVGYAKSNTPVQATRGALAVLRPQLVGTHAVYAMWAGWLTGCRVWLHGMWQFNALID